jgi:transposase
MGNDDNFKREADEMLETYEDWVVGQLQNAKITHHDETGINIGAKRVWLHSTSNEQFTH